MDPRRIALALAALGIALAAAPPGLAQQEPEAAPSAPAQAEGPAAYPLAEISLQAEQTRSTLADASQRLVPDKTMLALDEQLGATLEEIDGAAAETQRRLSAAPVSMKTLDDLERQWLGRKSRIEGWRDQVTTRAAEVDGAIARLGELRERWKLTRESATASDAATAMGWIDGALELIDKTAETAGERARALVALQNRIGELEARTSATLEAIRLEVRQQRGRLLEPDSPPIWEDWRPAGDLEGVRSRLRDDWEQDVRGLRSFVATSGIAILQFGLLLVLIFSGTVMLGRRVDAWMGEDADRSQTMRVLHRPVSVTLLVSLLVSESFFPLAPGIFFELLGVLLLIPAVRLLAPLANPALRPVIYALAAFYFSSQVRVMIEAAPVASRLLFTLELLVAIAALGWVARSAGRAPEEPAQAPPAWLGRAAKLVLASILVAFVANVLGYLGFAKILARGLLIAVYAALIARGTWLVAMIFVSLLMRTPVARRLRMVRLGGESIGLWVGRFLAALLAFLWLEATLDAFAIRRSVFDFVDGVTGKELAVGALTISLGDVLTFAFVIVASFYLARFVRFVLEEDVFPRVVMRRGVPNAIGTTATYTILLIGLVLALGAAGVELSRVTLLAGAFGVGIGFGLQDVVNNFVSGLILLFERPIQVGDMIEMHGDALLGEVRRIGPRSSTVRTFDGAEVIVPNGMLISSQVINWTLSDRRRRLTVPIGVKYGSDPERVLAILRQVADENETVLDDPAPLCIFQGFGDSSLDFELRCWIPRYEEGLSMATALRVVIYAKLQEAGIEIPFPQRDLHLRTVDENAARTLLGEGDTPRSHSRNP